MSYDKSERIIIVRDVIERHRRIPTADVVKEVAVHYLKKELEKKRTPPSKVADELRNRLGQATKRFGASVRSDLRDLKNFGFIEAEYYSFVENQPLSPAPEDLKKEGTYNIIWVWKGATSEILGSPLLHNFRATFFSDKSLAHELKIDYFLRDPIPGFINMIFLLGLTRLNLTLNTLSTLNQEESDFLLLVGRPSDPIFNPIEANRERLPGKNKKRVGALLVPTETLSACRSDARPGHFGIQVHDSHSVDIFDFNSSNHTWAKTIAANDAHRFLAMAPTGSGKTKTRAAPLGEDLLHGSNFTQIEPGKGRRFRLPVLIKASQHFHMLVLAPPPR